MPLSPISRIEQSSKNRRCGILRETVYNILKEAYVTYSNNIISMQSEISKTNLTIMQNMYNIIPYTESEDDWNNVDSEKDKFSLEYLKHCFQKMHAKRRECLCHFLALDVMTPGRDSHRRDYEHHWAAVNNHLNELGATIGHYLETINLASANELCK